MATSRHARAATMPAIREYLAIRVGDQPLGLDFGCVQEIHAQAESGKTACADYVAPTDIELRDTRIPLIDLRECIDPARRPGTPGAVIIAHAAGIAVALAVDEVLDVIDVARQSLKPPSQNPAHQTWLASQCEFRHARMTGPLFLIDIGGLLASRHIHTAYGSTSIQ
jgi:chemotaxis signal transduction protein